MGSVGTQTYPVLLVDGPQRGETIQIDNPYRTDWVIPQPPAVPLRLHQLDEPLSTIPDLKVAHYKITRLRVFGEHILVGSINYRPTDHDLFMAIANDKAKAAVI